MPLSPQRRRRALRAHELRQHCFTIREIAAELHVSPTTIHDDLRAVETHQADFARATAQDALLQHLALLRRRIHELTTDPLKPLEPFAAQQPDGTVKPLFQHIKEADLIRYLQQRDRALESALREYRLTARELLRAADAGQLNAEAAEAAAQAVNDYPAEELADAPPPINQPIDQPTAHPAQLPVTQPEQTPNNPEQTRTNLNNSEPPQPPRPDRTTHHIPLIPPDQTNPEQPTPDHLLNLEVAEILQSLQDAHQDDDLWSHPETAQTLKEYLAATL